MAINNGPGNDFCKRAESRDRGFQQNLVSLTLSELAKMHYPNVGLTYGWVGNIKTNNQQKKTTIMAVTFPK